MTIKIAAGVAAIALLFSQTAIADEVHEAAKAEMQAMTPDQMPVLHQISKAIQAASAASNEGDYKNACFYDLQARDIALANGLPAQYREFTQWAKAECAEAGLLELVK